MGIKTISNAMRRMAMCLLALATLAHTLPAQEPASAADSLALAPQEAATPAGRQGDTAAADSQLGDSLLRALLPAEETAPATARDNTSKARWTPSPAKATWLALVFPGGGQIYNRKYWKLPIIYGGFMGCIYAIQWNGQMYADYQQAYLDIMDSDPGTQSYMNFLPPNYDVSANEEYLKKIFKSRKDRYRRYRDLSVFCFVGVYLVSVLDAYVDAELSSFDISKDLSMKVAPSVIENRYCGTSHYGVQCSISF